MVADEPGDPVAVAPVGRRPARPGRAPSRRDEAAATPPRCRRTGRPPLPAPQRVRTASAPTPSGAARRCPWGSIATRRGARGRRRVRPRRGGLHGNRRRGDHLRLRVRQVHSGQPEQAAGDLPGVGAAVAQIDPPEPGEVAGRGPAAAPAALTQPQHGVAGCRRDQPPGRGVAEGVEHGEQPVRPGDVLQDVGQVAAGVGIDVTVEDDDDEAVGLAAVDLDPVRVGVRGLGHRNAPLRSGRAAVGRRNTTGRRSPGGRVAFRDVG